tara:strand:+ start:792 stop:1451 length:660 start_codon:yes stop_codon:yes gene_type:complete
MDSNDFLLLSLAVTGLALLVSLFVSTSERAVIEESPISGWKKFTIRPEALAGGGNQRTLVSSQEGGELEVLSGNSGSFPIKIGHRKHGALLVIEKPLLSLKSSLKMSLLGQPWIQIRTGRKGGIPRLVGVGTRMADEVPEAGSLRLNGDLPAREYEIRIREKVAATVFREQADDSVDGSCYRVALPEGIPELPFLALIVGLEVELAACARPARTLSLES